MNPPSIDLYRNRGVDLSREPLEIAVCAQHNNGRFAVDRWWKATCLTSSSSASRQARTSKRPGGSALNAGQVELTARRPAIAHAMAPTCPLLPSSSAPSAIPWPASWRRSRRDPPRRKRPRCAEEVQRDTAAHDRLRWRLAQPGGASRAVDAARRLLVEIRRDGLRIEQRRHFCASSRRGDVRGHLGYLIAIRT